jgi:Tol biopolymer transport system component
MVLLQGTAQHQVYLGELAAGGMRMNPPRRLTNDEANDWPAGWTPDSKAVLFASDRNGQSGIFEQVITQDGAESVIAGPQGAGWPRFSADGLWILYAESSNPVPSAPIRLMRVPVSGGVPQFVLDTQGGWSFDCARAPASLCVILEAGQDENHLTLTAFDPLRGRGKTLRTIEKDRSPDWFWGSALSPDGSTLALSRADEAEILIRLLSLSGGSDREFTVKGWPNLSRNGLYWSFDGKALYVGSFSQQASTLLYVDLNGNAQVLWQQKGAVIDLWAVPSPDGRYLAILDQHVSSNVWMLEGF